MIICNTKKLLEGHLSTLKVEGKTIGFVPTMGALHKGHTDLMQKAANECDMVIVSIFVNPTQFNEPNDLKNYPRTLEHDTQKCQDANVGILFIPSEHEIYPEPDSRVFDFGRMGEVMEGKHRPGHFNGVAQVVSRLFSIVNPHKAYFGQKDFQQLAIVRKLVQMLDLPIDIVACPTVREPDGLAMSSRNMLLTEEQRANAPLAARTLMAARNKKATKGVQELTDWVIEQVDSNPMLSVEYFQIVNAASLEPIESWEDAPQAVGCIAVRAGQVRLIDNIFFE